jgi:hypothetical protein
MDAKQTRSLRAGKISIPTAIFMGALGPMKIIEQLRPSYARRYNRLLLDLSIGFSNTNYKMAPRRLSIG